MGFLLPSTSWFLKLPIAETRSLIERFSITFTANGKRQAEISRFPKTRKIYLVSAYILPVATAMELVLKTEK